MKRENKIKSTVNDLDRYSFQRGRLAYDIQELFFYLTLRI